MPNVLDTEPMRAFARRIVSKLDDPDIAARLERLAYQALLDDPRNFRIAGHDDLQNAPAWAALARSRGEELHVFVVHRGASARLRTLAKRLSDACKVANADIAERPRDAAVIAAAREFLDKFSRASIDVAARKALFFSRVLAAWSDTRDSEPRCEARSVRTARRRTWTRIRSIAELRSTGREFRNCLARTTRSASYGRMLHAGLAQFWVLREADGHGLIIAMAPAPLAHYFTEVRGPRNAVVTPEDLDLAHLARAIGITPEAPPPPPDGAALALPPRRRRLATPARTGP